MKKILWNFLLLGGILFVFSCCSSQYNLDDLLMQKYHKILYVKDSGTQNVTVNTAGANPEDSIMIVKAGSQPTAKADVKIKVLTQPEMEAAFDSLAGYTILPNDYYSFGDGNELPIGSDERAKFFHIIFNASKIRAAIKLKPNLKFALPLQLVSDHDTINTNLDKKILVLNVVTPTLKWSTEDLDQSMAYKSLDVELTAGIDNYDKNVNSFTCGLDVENNADLVASYNTTHGTSYEVLPETAYKMNDFSFAQDSDAATTKLTVSRSGLVNDHTYLLPLKFKQTSALDQLDLSANIQYLVVHNPKYGFVVPDRSNWKIVFCNEDNRFYGTGANYAGAPAMLDNDITTYWMYNLDGDYAWQYQGSGHALGDDYNYDFTDYHAFYGDRYTPNQVIVIDMKESRSIMGIGIVQRQDLWACLQSAKFYVSDDKEFKFVPIEKGGDAADYNNVALNNWTPLFTYSDIPSQTGICWHQLSASEIVNGGAVKGRFLKIVPLLGSRGAYSHGSCIAELKVMQLVSVDGNAVE